MLALKTNYHNLTKEQRKRKMWVLMSSPAMTSANRNKQEKLWEWRYLIWFLSNVAATQHFNCCLHPSFKAAFTANLTLPPLSPPQYCSLQIMYRRNHTWPWIIEMNDSTASLRIHTMCRSSESENIMKDEGVCVLVCVCVHAWESDRKEESEKCKTTATTFTVLHIYTLVSSKKIQLGISDKHIETI